MIETNLRDHFFFKPFDYFISPKNPNSTFQCFPFIIQAQFHISYLDPIHSN